MSADCKRGRRKGATSKNVKNRQKVSKSFSTLFDNFRAGQKTSKIVKKCQKVFRHFSTIFARHLSSGPFCNPLTWKTSTKEFCDTIAISLARYEKYRCWPSKGLAGDSHVCDRMQRFSQRVKAREGANREKLTVKKLISITRCFFTVCVPYKP